MAGAPGWLRDGSGMAAARGTAGGTVTARVTVTAGGTMARTWIGPSAAGMRGRLG
jgi:hypothetical protein